MSRIKDNQKDYINKQVEERLRYEYATRISMICIGHFQRNLGMSFLQMKKCKLFLGNR